MWSGDRQLGYITYSAVYPHALFSSLCVCVRFFESCFSEDFNTVECFIILLTHSDRVTHIYIRRLTILSLKYPSLACRLIGAWPLSEPMLNIVSSNLTDKFQDIYTFLIKEMYLKTLRYLKILCPYFITLYCLESSFYLLQWTLKSVFAQLIYSANPLSFR